MGRGGAGSEERDEEEWNEVRRLRRRLQAGLIIIQQLREALQALAGQPAHPACRCGRLPGLHFVSKAALMPSVVPQLPPATAAPLAATAAAAAAAPCRHPPPALAPHPRPMETGGRGRVRRGV